MLLDVMGHISEHVHVLGIHPMRHAFMMSFWERSEAV